MSLKTEIAYASSTWSPWIGCDKVSPGCAHCYADLLDLRRFSKTIGGGTKANPIRHFGPSAPRHITQGWEDPVRWNHHARTKQFAWDTAVRELFSGDESAAIAAGFFKPVRPRIMPSMCDWLDQAVPAKVRARFLKLVFETSYLDWLLFSKRPENWLELISQVLIFDNGGDPSDKSWFEKHGDSFPKTEFGEWLNDWTAGTPPTNLWSITSIENQKYADLRCPEALKIPAVVHGLSIEPMLGPINLKGCNGFDWVIVGGESGPNARPMHPQWADSIREQCAAANVPFWFKQWGEWCPRSKCCGGPEDFGTVDPMCKKWPSIRMTYHGKDGHDLANVTDEGDDIYMQRVGATRAGSTLFGRTHTQLPTPNI